MLDAGAAQTCAHAKVPLLGNDGVGKTALYRAILGLPYAATEPTEFRQSTVFGEVTDGELRRSAVLWDLTGRAGGQLVNELHLTRVGAAIVVFDARTGADPFAGVRGWVTALRRHSADVPALLVKARADVGGATYRRQDAEDLCEELELVGFFETSAFDGRGIAELSEAVHAAIDWSAGPSPVAADLVAAVEDFVRDERVLALSDDLYRAFLGGGGDAASRADFDACLGQLEMLDRVRRLADGEWILFRPELLDREASVLVDAAREEPDGLGLLAEAAARSGAVPFASAAGLFPGEERKVREAVVEELVQYGLVLREQSDDGPDLIFPAQRSAGYPDEPDPRTPDVLFHFDGGVWTIYSTLVVRLGHTDYRREALYRDASTYRPSTGGMCGLRVRDEDGHGELAVFFAPGTSEETKLRFEDYVEKHLEKRALPGSVVRERLFVCPECGDPLSADVIRKRRARGHSDAICSSCEKARVSLLDRKDRLRPVPAEVTIPARASAEFDAFLSYNREDGLAVEDIARRLGTLGLRPWLDVADMPPGEAPWQDVLARQIDRAPAAVIFLGPHGLGPWQAFEQRKIMDTYARRKSLRIVPVLLGGAEIDVLDDGFLGQWPAVDFRTEPDDAFRRLLWGLTGERPANE